MLIMPILGKITKATIKFVLVLMIGLVWIRMSIYFIHLYLPIDGAIGVVGMTIGAVGGLVLIFYSSGVFDDIDRIRRKIKEQE